VGRQLQQEKVMGFDLQLFADGRLDADYLEWLVDEQSADIQRHFGRL